MKVTTIFALLLVSASAFNPPQFATRAVGKAPATKAVAKKAPAKKAPAKKAPAKKFSLNIKKAAPKKAAPKKAAPKKAAPKKAAPKKAAPKFQAAAAARKPPPASKGYPSFAAKAQNFKLGGGRISGGAAGKTIVPVFVHPTVNNEPVPSFDYKEAAKARVTPTQNQEFLYDDGLTIIERKQKKTIPAFLTGSARSKVVAEAPRNDIEVTEYPFGLSADRFQLLFITLFSLFTLVGCLSGTVQLD